MFNTKVYLHLKYKGLLPEQVDPLCKKSHIRLWINTSSVKDLKPPPNLCTWLPRHYIHRQNIVSPGIKRKSGRLIRYIYFDKFIRYIYFY